MMDKPGALAAAHGWAAAEFAAWGFAATLDDGTRRTVELALGMHGIDGLGDLVAAGLALGGLSAAQVGALLAFVEAELGERVLAA